ncbi:AraC-like DNA-binding protein [Chryseobacterium sp. SORGH_AS 447]|uniref:AraC family transcriptional regulator n=1 Tax=Chryseobacterium sp. SORGH_AS_0447 TaxID=3041769 RepID=UPI00277D2E9A|nr:AraC family transcriptional regulator [Chryseobacterium sp. SORGH_AS_0447]MDQ1161805.1 AraC-like DNA-binding protein [Chryseobacterium sp. SORGH_AS_0447]
MMHKIFLIPFLLMFFALGAQDQARYQAIYAKTYLETSQQDFGRALKVADSLYEISENPYFRTKSLMLSASLYQQSGDVEKAVAYAERSAGIIEGAGNPAWESRVYGFLATQYRILKLYKKSKVYIEKALEAGLAIKEEMARNSIQGLMYQEMAYYETEHKNYKKSIRYIETAQSHFNRTRENLDFFTANNEQLTGLNYFYSGAYEKAMDHYRKALALAEKSPENFLTGLICNGMAAVYLKQDDLKNAALYLGRAQKIAENSNYPRLKIEVNTTSQAYYSKLDDNKKSAELQQKTDTLSTALAEKESAFIDDSYVKMEHKAEVAEKDSGNKNNMLLAGTFLLAGCSFAFFRYRKRQIRNTERISRLLQEYERRIHTSDEGPELKAIEPDEPGAEGGETAVMTSETEQKLLRQLREFEESVLYTDRNMSLPFLAAHLGTNIKYLSHIINRYKKKDFNNYINELRINYIIRQLRENPEFRKYKIATLADESGFSSANKFTTVFKKVTEIPPSVFIRHIQELTVPEVQEN